MGFYPVDPVSLEYVIGAPQIPKASIKLPDGKVFAMEAHHFSKKNKYVKYITLNGKPLEGFIITHANIMDGGKLEFIMADKPLHNEVK